MASVRDLSWTWDMTAESLFLSQGRHFLLFLC